MHRGYDDSTQQSDNECFHSAPRDYAKPLTTILTHLLFDLFQVPAVLLAVALVPRSIMKCDDTSVLVLVGLTGLPHSLLVRLLTPEMRICAPSRLRGRNGHENASDQYRCQRNHFY